MKKGLILFFTIPFLCACSGKEISNDEAYKMMTNFENNLEQNKVEE